MTDTITNAIDFAPDGPTWADVDDLRTELANVRAELVEARVETAYARSMLSTERAMHDDLAQALLDAAERFSLCGEYERFVDEYPNARLIRRARSYAATVEVTLTVTVRVDDITDPDDVADSIDTDTVREALGLGIYSSATVDTWDVTDSEVID